MLAAVAAMLAAAAALHGLVPHGVLLRSTPPLPQHSCIGGSGTPKRTETRPLLTLLQHPQAAHQPMLLAHSYQQTSSSNNRVDRQTRRQRSPPPTTPQHQQLLVPTAPKVTLAGSPVLELMQQRHLQQAGRDSTGAAPQPPATQLQSQSCWRCLQEGRCQGEQSVSAHTQSSRYRGSQHKQYKPTCCSRSQVKCYMQHTCPML